MVKKTKPSAYGNFMQAMKPKVEKRLGCKIPFEQLSVHVESEWKRMSAAEKAKYAPYKTKIPLDSSGVPLTDYVEVEERERQIKEDMLSGIGNMIDLHVTGDVMPELEVVVVAATEYVTTDEGEVIPAEVSLVRLTLGGGLDPKRYHAIINPPSSWPLGYAALARIRVAHTHCLPIDLHGPGYVGTNSRDLVAADMKKFLTQRNDSGRLCPVFTLEERLAPTRTVFKQSFDMDYVDVWCLEDLLRAAFGALYPRHSGVYTNTHARDELVNSAKSPDYNPTLGCKWHRENRPDEVNHCSLNMAQRWGFLLLHALNVETSLGVKIIEGRHWPGPCPDKGVVIQLATHDRKRNLRDHMTSMQTSNTASEGFSDSDTETGSVAGSSVSVASNYAPVASSYAPSKSRREKTWQEIEDGPKTPVLQSSEEFPSLGGGRNQHSKTNGRGGAWGFSKGACGGPSTARTEAGESSSCGNNQMPPSKRNGQNASSKGTGERVNMKNAAACLVEKSDQPLGRRQQGAAVKSRGGGGGSSYTAHVEEQLRLVNLNDGRGRTGESGQRTAASMEEPKREPSKQNGVGGAQQPSGQHARPAAAGQARPALSLSGMGRGRKR